MGLPSCAKLKTHQEVDSLILFMNINNSKTNNLCTVKALVTLSPIIIVPSLMIYNPEKKGGRQKKKDEKTNGKKKKQKEMLYL